MWLPLAFQTHTTPFPSAGLQCCTNWRKCYYHWCCIGFCESLQALVLALAMKSWTELWVSCGVFSICRSSDVVGLHNWSCGRWPSLLCQYRWTRWNGWRACLQVSTNWWKFLDTVKWLRFNLQSSYVCVFVCMYNCICISEFFQAPVMELSMVIVECVYVCIWLLVYVCVHAETGSKWVLDVGIWDAVLHFKDFSVIMVKL